MANEFITCEKCGVCKAEVRLYQHKYARDFIGQPVTRFLCPSEATSDKWERVR